MPEVVERDITLEIVYPCILQVTKVTSQDHNIDAKSRGVVARENTTGKHTCGTLSLRMMRSKSHGLRTS